MLFYTITAILLLLSAPKLILSLVANVLLLPVLLIALFGRILASLPILNLIGQLILSACQSLCRYLLIPISTESYHPIEEFKHSAESVQIFLGGNGYHPEGTQWHFTSGYTRSTTKHSSRYFLPHRYQNLPVAKTFDELVNQHVTQIKTIIENNPQATQMTLGGNSMGGAIMAHVLEEHSQDFPSRIQKINLFVDRTFTSTSHLLQSPSFAFLPIGVLILKITGWSINPLKKLNQLIQKITNTKTSIYINEVKDDSLLHGGGLKAQHMNTQGHNQVFKKTMPDPSKEIPNHCSYDHQLLKPSAYEKINNHYKAG